jgi:adenylate cyclase
LRAAINRDIHFCKRKTAFFKLFFAITLILLSGNAFAGTQVDSIMRVVGKIDDTIKVRRYKEEALKIFDADSSGAITLINQSILIANNLRFKRGIVEGLAAKASLKNKLNLYEESLMLYDSAATVAVKYGVPDVASSSLYNAGLVCYMRSRYAEALNYFMRDLKLSEQQHDSTKMSVLYNDIGVVYENLTDYENSLLYHHKSLQIRKQLNDSAGIAMSNNNLGMVVFYEKKYKESLKFHQESLRLRNKMNDHHGAIYSLFNISNIFFAVSSLNANDAISIFPFTAGEKAERISGVLLDSALSLRKTALKGAVELSDDYATVYCTKGIGEIYVLKKEWNKALKYLKEAESKARELGMQKELSEIYLNLHDAYFGLHQVKDALRYHTLYTATKDSVFNMQSARQIAALQTKIIVDNKEKEIELLNVKSEAQVKEISRQKLLRNITISGILAFMCFSIVIYRQRNRINKEKKRSDSLLLNILPAATAEELKATGTTKVRKHDVVTVMFTDFRNFTGISEKMSPEDLVMEINHCFSAFDNIISKYAIEKIKTIGDSYMCAAGLPTSNEKHALDSINAAIEIRDFMLNYRASQHVKGLETFEIRIGLHTGPVVSGIVGTKKFAYDIWGDTVNIASRMESSGEAGKVNISGACYELIQKQFDCIHRGTIEARNRGMIEMYFVEEKR